MDRSPIPKKTHRAGNRPRPWRWILAALALLALAALGLYPYDPSPEPPVHAELPAASTETVDPTEEEQQRQAQLERERQAQEAEKQRQAEMEWQRQAQEAEQRHQAEVDTLVQRLDNHLGNQHYTHPEEASALLDLQALSELEPQHPAIARGREEMAGFYVDAAQQAISVGRRASAEDQIARGRRVAPNALRWEKLEERLVELVGVEESEKTAVHKKNESIHATVVSHPETGRHIGHEGRYTDNQDGTVTDRVTELQWMRCSVGQRWTGKGCSGKAKEMLWEKAQQQTAHFAGKRDWRIPSIEELRTLVYCSSGLPDYFRSGEKDISSCEGDYRQPTIDAVAFPNMSWYLHYWSPGLYDEQDPSSYVGMVNFYNGNSSYSHRRYPRYVRLVRGRQ